MGGLRVTHHSAFSNFLRGLCQGRGSPSGRPAWGGSFGLGCYSLAGSCWPQSKSLPEGDKVVTPGGDPWAAPGWSRPPPHTPGSPGLTTQSLRTIMVMMIWYWKYKGMSSGGPTARERETGEGLGAAVPPGGAGRWGGTGRQKPGCGASSVAPGQRRLEPWHPEKGAGSTRWHPAQEARVWHPGV